LSNNVEKRLKWYIVVFKTSTGDLGWVKKTKERKAGDQTLPWLLEDCGVMGTHENACSKKEAIKSARSKFALEGWI